MESIVQNVSDLGADQRQWLESALGGPLAEHQRVLIMVLNPGVEPDESIRAKALSRLEQLWEKGTRNRAQAGVSVADADAIVDEACRQARRTAP